MVVILDYGMGNLPNVARAVRHLGHECSIQKDLTGATKLILPGVGAFGAAMARLDALKPELKAFARQSPLMGICLGQQLLFEHSEEHGDHSGLEILGGDVRYFDRVPGIKVPHMGWNELRIVQTTGLHREAQEGEQAYFVHSLHVVPSDQNCIASTAWHGSEFVASVQQGHVWGTQFHPEKSGAVGLKMLKAFLEL